MANMIYAVGRFKSAAENSMNAPARTIRIIRSCFLVYVALLVYVVFKLPAHPHQPPGPAFEAAITVLGIASIWTGFYLPRRLRRIAERRLQAAPRETLLKRWFAFDVVSLASFLACVLYGFVLHILGAHNALAGLLFGAGIASMLIWSPGTPPA
jgi:hypothetical protein